MPETVDELRKKIIEKAKDDPNFRNMLMDKNTTKQALKEIGIILPDGINLSVLQETEHQFYLVLPMFPEDQHHHYHPDHHHPPVTW